MYFLVSLVQVASTEECSNYVEDLTIWDGKMLQIPLLKKDRTKRFSYLSNFMRESWING